MDDKEYICICGYVTKSNKRIYEHIKKCPSVLDIDSYDMQDWISEKHKCERCGKIMTEFYGIGRFCSKGCANARTHSNTTKEKISQKSKESYKNGLYSHIGQGRHDLAEFQYYQNPKICEICGDIIPYERRENKTCCSECQSRLRGNIMSRVAEEHGGNSNPYGYSNRKWGYYQGIKFDSGWEFAYWLYCKDHNIKIVRAIEAFPYQFNGEQHMYHPDFKINDDCYVEVKGRYKDEDYEKIAQFPKTEKLIIIDKTNYKKYEDYCKKVYGKDFETMYDKDKHSWMNPPKDNNEINT